MTFNKNIFDEIKASLASKNDSSYKDIMKFEAGKTYQVRIIPNLLEPKKTIYHYYHHSWKSYSNGQFITALCPTTYGGTCPIDSYVMKTYNTGTDAEKKKLSDISRKESWMVNAYVISDPTNPENEGKVKVIRYGKELAKIINSAIDGDDAAEFGHKIFDVANGCTLRIKCENRTGGTGSRTFVTYASSKFLSPSKLDGIDTDKLKTIHEGVFDLTKFNKTKTAAELQRMLDQHFFCIQDINEDVDDADEVETSTPTPVSKPAGVEDIFKGVETATAPAEDDTDAKLKALLAGL
jgi:gp32 DNA binding protein like